MLNKNEKEYLKAINKINLPEINGESKIKSKRFNFSKKIVVAASACVLFTMSMLGINLVPTTSGADNVFVIKAYSTTDDGNKSITLEKGQITKMPTRSDGEIPLQGLFIEGDNIEKIYVGCNSGAVVYSGSSNNESYIEDNHKSLLLAMDNESSEVLGIVTQYSDTDEIDIDKVGFSDGMFEIRNTDNLKYHYISWEPSYGIISNVENKTTYNNVEEIIKINVEFNDGTVQSGELKITFNENGEMIAEFI